MLLDRVRQIIKVSGYWGFAYRWLRIVLAACFIFVSNGCQTQEFKLPAPIATVYLAGIPLRVEVADTIDKQERGLSDRKYLTGLDGMLFVFDDEAKRHFWMRNTHMDLDLLFFDTQRRLVETTRLFAHDEKIYTSEHSVKYVLELDTGWLKQHPLQYGQRLSL